MKKIFIFVAFSVVASCLSPSGLFADASFVGVAVPNGKIRDKDQSSKAVLMKFVGNKLRRASQFAPFGKSARAPLFCASGEFTGDSTKDIVLAQGAGAKGGLKVFNGGNRKNLPGSLGTFNVFEPKFKSGATVAVGDVNGDGNIDIVAGAGGGTPQVVVTDSKTGAVLSSFFAYEPTFTGGVRVAVGDLSGDGVAEIVTAPGPGAGGPIVKVFSGQDNSLLSSFFAFEAGFSGGAYVAAGDVNGDGRDEIVVGAGKAKGGGPVVKVFDGQNGALLSQFFAYDPKFAGGVTVAVTSDANGDGKADIVTGPASGGNSIVKLFSFNGTTVTEIGKFAAFDKSYKGGVFVCAAPGVNNPFAEATPTVLPQFTATPNSPNSFVDVLSSVGFNNFQLAMTVPGCGLNSTVDGAISNNDLIFSGFPGNGPVTFVKNGAVVWRGSGIEILNVNEHEGTATADGCDLTFNFSNQSGGRCQAKFHFNPLGTPAESLLTTSQFATCP